MHKHPYENEFNFHVNEILFLYERIGTKTHFEKEAKGNSEMAYCSADLSYRSWSAFKRTTLTVSDFYHPITIQLVRVLPNPFRQGS